MQSLIGKLSMQSHLDELAGAVRTLASQTYVRDDRIFALANSEGTLHALNYQMHSPAIPFAGLVLIAPPGRPVGVVARSQLAAQAAGIPNGDTLLALYDEAIARFLAGEPMAPDPALPQGVQMLLQSLETPANLPFARELWAADAAPLLGQVDVPALVIIGKKDIQVDWQADGEPLQRAATGHANVTFLFPENANHVLKYEPRPRSELAQARSVAALQCARCPPGSRGAGQHSGVAGCPQLTTRRVFAHHPLARGSATVNVVPAPTVLRASITPPCACTIHCASANPSPLPCCAPRSGRAAETTR